MTSVGFANFDENITFYSTSEDGKFNVYNYNLENNKSEV